MGQKTPADHSVDVARIEAESSREARQAEEESSREARQAEEAAKLQAKQEEDAANAKKESDFQQRLASAFGTGQSEAEKYFTSQGLDPHKYSGLIQQKAASIKGGIPDLDTNPASYFANLGQDIYNQEQSGERNRDLLGLDKVAPSGFSTDRIGDTAADDLINSILGEQEKTADDYVENLFKRGVVTSGGKDAALKNILGQEAGGRSKLREIASGQINKGRSGAEDIVNKAREKASNQRLGDNFDPFSTGKDLSKYFSDFFSKLGTNIRGVAPTNLFDTAGLATIAGAAQGAGNTKFDPNAVAGIFDDTKNDKNNNPLSTTSPF